MNYKIVGQDGRIYGPASPDQIRQWIAQGRIESRTPIMADEVGAWTFVGLLPEFAGHFSLPPLAGAEASRGAGTNTYATWSLVCGCLAWVFCCCCPFNILGLVFGIIALVQIAARPQEGRSLAIAGVVLSGTNLLWCLGLTLINAVNGQTGGAWTFGPN